MEKLERTWKGHGPEMEKTIQFNIKWKWKKLRCLRRSGAASSSLASRLVAGGTVERAAARVCREAGATGRDDGRRLEVVANGLPAFGGVQVAVDVTLVSPLRRDGSSWLALRAATPQFRQARRCRLTVLALEVGGRCGEETKAFLHRIAQGRALASPAAQRMSQPRTGAGDARSCSSGSVRCEPLPAAHPPTLATRTPVRRSRATHSPTPVGRRGRRGRSCVSPCLTEGELLSAFLDDLYVRSSSQIGLSISFLAWSITCMLTPASGSMLVRPVFGTVSHLPESNTSPTLRLGALSTDHAALLDQLPGLPDLQAAWLLLLFCASARAHYVQHVPPPEQTPLRRSTAAPSSSAWRTSYSLSGPTSCPTPLPALPSLLFATAGSVSAAPLPSLAVRPPDRVATCRLPRRRRQLRP